MTVASLAIARRSKQSLAADPSRVIAHLFVPGQEGFDHQHSRTAQVLARLLALDEVEVQASLDDVLGRFEGRHRDLVGMFSRHADELADRLDPERTLSERRRLLLGAIFTAEYAIEGAALCNPSVVADPDQTDVPEGSLRFVMSVRAIGEGHRSSIGFRRGVVDPDGTTRIECPSVFATIGQSEPAALDGAVFRSELHSLDPDAENTDFVLDALGDHFTAAELEEQLARLDRRLTTRHSGRTSALMRRIAERTYGIRFPNDTELSERVLWPAMPAESHGMEDARFVRFTDVDGSIVHYATYTAYDGIDISQQLLETTDFRTFTSSPIVGPAAANKGLALFPRRIGGRFAALSRWDRETNSIAFSDNLCQWDDAVICQTPARAWEILQLGNCGAPIETEAGWLVLTHGVGPMRTYRIGALLLDIDDPTRVVGQLRQPLLSPSSDERDGYVPNVIYSCGSLVHHGNLVIPYGISDAAIGVATVRLDELLDALVPMP